MATGRLALVDVLPNVLYFNIFTAAFTFTFVYLGFAFHFNFFPIYKCLTYSSDRKIVRLSYFA
jgi:hypothetical protein